jgi:hypothetical protein
MSAVQRASSLTVYRRGEPIGRPEAWAIRERRMADLIAVVFPSEEKAEEVRQKLLAMTREYLIEIGDAAIATITDQGTVSSIS